MIQSTEIENRERVHSPASNRQPTFIAPKNRDAWSAIRGFVYQADLTIERWLSLESEQELHLECGEDIDTVSRYFEDAVEKRLVEQVKHPQSPRPDGAGSASCDRIHPKKGCHTKYVFFK